MIVAHVQQECVCIPRMHKRFSVHTLLECECVFVRKFYVPSTLLYLFISSQTYVRPPSAHKNSTHIQGFVILVLFFNSQTILCYCKTIVRRIGRQICPSGIGFFGCVFLELEDKFVQLELSVVSYCVIPRQICPIGIFPSSELP